MIDRADGRRPMPPEVESILAELAARPFAEMAEAQAFLDREIRGYNARPQEALGGLSPVQAFGLSHGDWRTEGVLRLDSGLSAADLAESDFFVNARTVLGAADAAGGVKATQKGNLTRGFVTEMLDACRWPARFPTDVREYSKAINEHDVFPLHVLRVILGLAGLFTRRRGAFRVTARGRRLLSDERAGELFERLFHTFFRSFNLGYLDGAPEAPGLQHTVAFTLHRLREGCRNWVRTEALPDDVILESVRSLELPADPMVDYAKLVLETRVLRPLVAFGLLERRDLEVGPWYQRPWEVRTTPLYDRFIRFEWERSAAGPI